MSDSQETIILKGIHIGFHSYCPDRGETEADAKVRTYNELLELYLPPGMNVDDFTIQVKAKGAEEQVAVSGREPVSLGDEVTVTPAARGGFTG